METFRANMAEDVAELREAFRADNASRARHYLLDIKGASAYIGAEVVFSQVSRMDGLCARNDMRSSAAMMDQLATEVDAAIGLMDKYIAEVTRGESAPRE